MKMVIVSGSRGWMTAIARRLGAAFPGAVAGHVMEATDSWKSRASQLKKRLKRYGLIRTLDQVLLQLALMMKHTPGDEGPAEAAVDYPVLRVESINDPEAENFIKKSNADFLVNIGGGLMERRVFGAVRVAAINIHPGICPRYRGANANFWAVYENNLDCVGVTVHRIDDGVDTGEVLFQKKIEVSKGVDTIESITLRSYEAGIEGVKTILSDFQASGRLPKFSVEAGEARTYGWHGLSQHLRAQKNLS